jgi:hypothetical protein
MVTELITEKRQSVRNWMWRQRLERANSSHAGLVGEGSELRFVLGISGTGAERLARVVAQPEVNLRFFHEPLGRFVPRLVLAGGGDRLAMPYTKELDVYHPVMRVLRMLVEGDNLWARRLNNRVKAEDPGTLPCLVSMSHGLLATEAMLRSLGAKALLYVGDPVKAVDRLLEDEGLESPYLEAEARSVLAPYFLARFLRRDYAPVLHGWRKIARQPDARRRKVLRLIVVSALIQRMFRMLAARYPSQAILVEYEQLARDPGLLNALLERLYGESGLEMAQTVALNSTFLPHKSVRPVWKAGWPEQIPAPLFLTSEEVQAGYRLLRETGLATRLAEQSRYRPIEQTIAAG